MVNVAFIITAALSVFLVLFGISILIRNPKEHLNRSFFAFAAAVSIWLVLNYISADPYTSKPTALISNRLVLIAGGASLITLLDFVLELANRKKGNRWWKPLLITNILSWMLCLTPWVVHNVSIVKNQVANSFGPLAAIYFGLLFVTFALIMTILFSGHHRTHAQRKAQLGIISTSIALVIPVIVACNAVFPLLGFYGAVSLSPLSISLIVFATYYAVAVHKLFDIRAFVFRALAYIVSAVILSVLYIGPVVFILDKFVGIPFSPGRFIVEVVLITLAATNYARIKRWFDGFTSKVFFRESYDSAELLGQLNSQLVSSTSLTKLFYGSGDLLAKTLKADFCAFILRDVKSDQIRLFVQRSKTMHAYQSQKLFNLLEQSDEKNIVTDNLSQNHNQLKSIMSGFDVAIALRMSDNKESQSLGYALLGYKKNGNAYNIQDIGTLTSATDALVIAIQNALRFEEIQNFNETLQRQVDERTRQLQRTNAKLVALDESKDDFISMASHQLRTPLTAVKGYLSMVLDGDGGKVTPVQRKMLGQAFISSQRMVFLIADLLNVSRLKTGKFVIERSEVDLAQMIDQEIDQLRETAASRNLELTYDKPKDFPRLMLDETKTRQVVMNYIDNSIHYTQTGGHISIELKQTPASVELRVRDDGIGVPKAEQHHLFTKFYRAVNARRQRPDGTGLGLFMAKKVIVAQGGAILFNSRERKGSMFGFTLPKHKLLVPATESAVSGIASKNPSKS